MTKSVFFTLTLIVGSLLSSSSVAQEPDKQAIIEASKDTQLLMPEPPLGYYVARLPIVTGADLLGFQVQVTAEDAISKVLIQIETTDRSEKAARVAATKGYINGFASSLRDSGLKLTDKKIPDIENADFQKPIRTELTFANDEDLEVFVKQRIFFTDKGFSITVIATSKEDLEYLTNWADKIQAKQEPTAPKKE